MFSKVSNLNLNLIGKHIKKSSSQKKLNRKKKKLNRTESKTKPKIKRKEARKMGYPN